MTVPYAAYIAHSSRTIEWITSPCPTSEPYRRLAAKYRFVCIDNKTMSRPAIIGAASISEQKDRERDVRKSILCEFGRGIHTDAERLFLTLK
jgi:hypothetical protein